MHPKKSIILSLYVVPDVLNLNESVVRNYFLISPAKQKTINNVLPSFLRAHFTLTDDGQR